MHAVWLIRLEFIFWISFFFLLLLKESVVTRYEMQTVSSIFGYDSLLDVQVAIKTVKSFYV